MPLNDKSGTVIGVIALHAEAPREFTRADSDFLMHSATLVAGAIENARLYQDTRRRLALVEGLADLARAVADAPGEDELLPAVAKRAHRLLGVEPASAAWWSDGGRLLLGTAWPLREGASRPLDAHELGLELAKSARRAGRRPPAGVDPVGRHTRPARRWSCRWWPPTSWSGSWRCGCPSTGVDAEEREIASSIAGQTAVAIRKVELIDRLTERNAIKDLLEDLSHGGGSAPELGDRARALGCDLDRPHLVLQAAPRAGTVAGPGRSPRNASRPPPPGRSPARCSTSRDAALRGLIRLRGGDEQAAVAKLREIHATLNDRHPLAIGLSHRCEGPARFGTGFEEAEQAVAAAAIVSAEPSVVGFDDLGAYKYLLRVAQDGRVRDRRGEALQVLVEYDRRHRSQLLLTLEEYLKRRGATSRRRRRPCTCTPTRCGSGCAESRI